MDMIATSFDIACSFRGVETVFREARAGYRAILPVGRVLWPTSRRILPIFLSSVGGHVEQSIGIRQRFGTTIVGRVRMKDIIIDPEKDTQPMRFARVRRYLKVIVEIAAKRRIPR